MLRYVLSLTLVLTFLMMIGCVSQTKEINATLGKEFTIAIGQSASIAEENLKVRLLEVVNDSRCPRGAECVWAGEAKSSIEITYLGTLYREVLTQPGLSEPLTMDFKEYEITFNLQPYPEVGKEIQSKDYRLQLVINKKPALTGGILVTFDVVDETYHVFVTNKETIEQIFSVQRGESKAAIPNGQLVKGMVSYNKPWSWHIDPENIHMAEVTIELCDGTPSQVEANLDYWVNTVQRFCPWSAKIVKIEDFRYYSL